MANASGDIAVELTDIEKRFPGVLANYDVNLTVRRGTIHSIVGENGAGKSTLMKVLYGMHQPEEGSVSVDGAEVAFRTPADAISAGIGMVHQHFKLADNLTVLENIILGSRAQPGRWPHRFRRRSQQHHRDHATDRHRARSRRTRVRARCRRTPAGGDHQGSLPRRQHLDPRRADRRVGARRGRRTLCDAPTSRRRWRDGHLHLAQARRGAQRLGRHHRHAAGHHSCAHAARRHRSTRARRTHGRVGTPLPGWPQHHRRRHRAPGVSRHHGRRVRGADPTVQNATLEVKEREILGIAGVEGNGQFELCAALLGLTASATAPSRSTVWTSARISTADRYDAGLAYIPFDRHREGLMLTAPLWQNTLLGRDHEPELRNGPLVNARPQSLRLRRSLSGSVSSRPTPTPRRSPSRVATSRSCSSDERW